MVNFQTSETLRVINDFKGVNVVTDELFVNGDGHAFPHPFHEVDLDINDVHFVLNVVYKESSFTVELMVSDDDHRFNLLTISHESDDLFKSLNVVFDFINLVTF